MVIFLAFLLRCTDDVTPSATGDLMEHTNCDPCIFVDVIQMHVIETDVLQTREHIVISTTMDHEIISNETGSMRESWARRLSFWLQLNQLVIEKWFIDFVFEVGC